MRAERPQNVRIVHRDGSVTPLELVYAGRHGGSDIWKAATKPDFRAGDSVKADVVPGRCQIRFG